MKNPRDIISQTPLFKGLPEQQIKELRDIAIVKPFAKGAPVFSEGDEARGFYVVVDGRVKVFKVSADGKEQILHIFEAGEPFGEVPVFSGQRFPASAETISESRLLFFPRSDFVQLIASNPSMALNMLAVLSKRLRQFTVQVENLSLKEVPARLAAYLIYLSEGQGAGDVADLNISKSQLAALLGTIPETLSRIFSRLNNEGLIQVRERRIRILDRDALADLAERGRHTD